MLSLSTAAGAPLSVTIDGKETLVPRLTMADMALLGEKLYRLQQAENAHTLKVLLGAGVKPDQLPSIVRELERRPAYVEVRRWLFTAEGSLEAVAIAGKSLGWTKESIGHWQDHEVFQDVALQLAGINLAPSPEVGGGAIPLSATSTPTTGTG